MRKPAIQLHDSVGTGLIISADESYDPDLSAFAGFAPYPRKGILRGRMATGLHELTKMARNEPGPGGSGKKYKKCCLLRPEEGGAAPFQLTSDGPISFIK